MGSSANNLKRMKQQGKEFQFWRWTKDSGKGNFVPKKQRGPKRKQSVPQLLGSTPNLRKIGFQPQMPSVGATELSQPS